MTGEYIELIIEFSVILLAPIIHTIYLRKVKKVDSSVIQQNIRIFSFFYALIAICVVVILTMPKAPANELHRHYSQSDDRRRTNSQPSQASFHCDIHQIYRREGVADSPRSGVSHVIAGN
jgi:hypothetical protein